MDPRNFDNLTRGLAGRGTRRGLLAGMAAGVLGALGLRGDAVAQATATTCGNVICRSDPGKCKPGCVCCVAANGNSRCSPAGQCRGGQPLCPPDRPYVDPIRGCVQCLRSDQCPTPGDPCAVAACVNGACGTVAAAANTPCRAVAGICDVAETCDGVSKTCPTDRFLMGTTCRSASCSGGLATAAATCSGTGVGCPAPVTRSCAPYVCAGSTCATTCANDGQCTAGYHCDGAACLANVGPGQACDESSDCASGFCVGGICCDTACTGACETCAGLTPGTCSAVVCPEMTANVCQSTTGTCDPDRQACVYPVLAEGTRCDSPTSFPCTTSVCTATGTCVRGVDRCHPECQSCIAGENRCLDVESFPPPSLRVTCDAKTGYCTDGACDYPCGEACIGQCFDRYSVSGDWLGSFCCKNNLDGNGECCWVNDEFGVVGDDGACRPASTPCCDDSCCDSPGSCFCSFGRISRCC